MKNKKSIPKLPTGALSPSNQLSTNKLRACPTNTSQKLLFTSQTSQRPQITINSDISKNFLNLDNPTDVTLTRCRSELAGSDSKRLQESIYIKNYFRNPFTYNEQFGQPIDFQILLKRHFDTDLLQIVDNFYGQNDNINTKETDTIEFFKQIKFDEFKNFINLIKTQKKKWVILQKKLDDFLSKANLSYNLMMAEQKNKSKVQEKPDYTSQSLTNSNLITYKSKFSKLTSECGGSLGEIESQSCSDREVPKISPRVRNTYETNHSPMIKCMTRPSQTKKDIVKYTGYLQDKGVSSSSPLKYKLTRQENTEKTQEQSLEMNKLDQLKNFQSDYVEVSGNIFKPQRYGKQLQLNKNPIARNFIYNLEFQNRSGSDGYISVDGKNPMRERNSVMAEKSQKSPGNIEAKFHSSLNSSCYKDFGNQNNSMVDSCNREEDPAKRFILRNPSNPSQAWTPNLSRPKSSIISKSGLKMIQYTRKDYESKGDNIFRKANSPTRNHNDQQQVFIFKYKLLEEQY